MSINSSRREQDFNSGKEAMTADEILKKVDEHKAYCYKSGDFDSEKFWIEISNIIESQQNQLSTAALRETARDLIIESQQKEIAELREDKKRLDWLETQQSSGWQPTTRQTIDAAMQETKSMP